MIDRKLCKQRTKCAVMMQCVVRGHKARLVRDRRLPAACKIARWMRSRLYRVRLLKQRKAVQTIQDYFRTKQTRRRYLKLRKFIMKLEADGRQHVLAARV